MSKLLIVDDEKNMREMLRDIVSSKDHQAALCANAEEALELLDREEFDAAIVDLNLPGISGMEFLRRICQRTPPLPAIMITAYGTIDAAVEAMRLGAFDFIIKPFDVKRILQVLANCLESASLVSQVKLSSPEFKGTANREIHIIGEDGQLRHVFEMVRKIARTDASHSGPS